MSNPNGLTDEDHLREQIQQLREAVSAIENKNEGKSAMHPEELWTMMQANSDETKPMHPRLIQILRGHVDVDSLKLGLKRLENDLDDLARNEQELYDPPKNDLEEEEDEMNGSHFSNAGEAADDDAEDEEQTAVEMRDKNQRPLDAYRDS